MRAARIETPLPLPQSNELSLRKLPKSALDMGEDRAPLGQVLAMKAAWRRRPNRRAPCSCAAAPAPGEIEWGSCALATVVEQGGFEVSPRVQIPFESNRRRLAEARSDDVDSLEW